MANKPTGGAGFPPGRLDRSLRNQSKEDDLRRLRNGIETTAEPFAINVQQLQPDASKAGIAVKYQFALPLLGGTTGVVWTDQPAAETEFLGLAVLRTYVDLNQINTIRLILSLLTAGATGSYITVEYSLNNGATWDRLLGDVGLALDTGGTIKTGWKKVPTDARTDVLIKIVGGDGDAAADPEFGLMMLQCRGEIGETVEASEIAI